MEAMFHKALHELGLDGTIEDTDCDEVIAIVQRQHEVAVDLEHRKNTLTAHIGRVEQKIAEVKQNLQVCQ